MADTKMADKELVVLHDMVSYADPTHDPRPGEPRSLRYATRGQKVGGDDMPIAAAEAKRLMDLGAVSADDGSLNAKLALSGAAPDTRLNPNYIALTSPAEQVRATQVAHRQGGPGPSSPKRELARLALADLKTLAVAFGYPDLAESDSADEIINVMKGDAEDAESPEETENNRQIRDENMIAGREFSREPGLLGANVTAQGVNADTGEKTQPIESRRQSRKTATDKK